MKTLFFISALMVSLASGAEQAHEPGIDELVQCAMFHRMMAASFSDEFGSGLESLQGVELEKMQGFVKRARDLSDQQLGDDAEAAFNDEWQYYLKEMFDQINRNYKNVSRLKYRYRERCANMAG